MYEHAQHRFPLGHWDPRPSSGTVGGRVPDPEHRTGRGGRGTRGRRRVLPRPPLRTSTRFAVPCSPRWVRARRASTSAPASSTCATEPRTFAEDAAAADLIAGGRLQLGISRGSPEQVVEGWRYYGFEPRPGETDADMARRQSLEALELIAGKRFAEPNPHPMFPNPPGLLRVEPYSEGLRQRIWWGAASDETARWAAQQGVNLMSSTLKKDESGEPLHVQQRKQIEAFREWARPNGFTPWFRCARSPIRNDPPPLFMGGGDAATSMGTSTTWAVFGRTYADEPDALIEQLRADEAIAAADTLMLTAPTQPVWTTTPTSSRAW